MLKLPISTIIFSLLSLVLSKTYQTLDGNAPIVIAHRGASGLRPDHTLSAYILAIEQGADFIEPDLLMTKDGVLICRHEPMLSLSTNVSKFPEFADRRKWKVVSGLSYHDWFVDDFTVEELKRLGAKQPSAERSRKYDYQDTISTFDEVIELVKNKSAELGRTIGIYPELKHPSFHIHANLPLTDKLLETLDREGWNHNGSAVYVQSMEVATLQYVRSKSTVKLVQLFLGSGCDKTGKMLMYSPNAQPYDFILAKDHRTFRDLTTNEGLDFIKTYADGIGVWTPYVIPYTFQDRNLDNRPDDLNGDGWIDSRDYIRLPTSDLVDRAHERGLLVHVWKLRDEPSSLLSDYAGNPLMEYADVYDAGVDGVFSDYTLTAVTARAAL